MKPIKFKARPAALKNKPQACSGKHELASSPEASLLAAVIRQAVDDYGLPKTAGAGRSFHHERRYVRFQAQAKRFLFQELQEFLSFYGVTEIFHKDTIVRGVKRVYGESDEVAPHQVEPTQVSPLDFFLFRNSPVNYIPLHYMRLQTGNRWMV